MRIFCMLFLLCFVITGGCAVNLGQSNTRSDNYYAYAARSAGDAAITIVGDQAKLDANTMAVLAVCATELEKFISSGEASELTSGELATQIKYRIPAEYQSYFAIALEYLSSSKVETNAIVPAKVLRLVKNAIHGIATGASYWVDPVVAATEATTNTTELSKSRKHSLRTFPNLAPLP